MVDCPNFPRIFSSRMRALVKTHLFQTEVEYLGFGVMADGIHMRDNHVDKILQWPVPQTPKELSSFLDTIEVSSLNTPN